METKNVVIANHDQAQVILEQQKRIEELEQTMQIAKKMFFPRTIQYLFPINKKTWVKQNPVIWSINEMGYGFTVFASSVYQSRDDYGPHNLFTLNDKEGSMWATDANHQNNSWIILKYPVEMICNYLRLKSRARYTDQAPTKFEVRWSNQLVFVPGSFKTLATYDVKFLDDETKEFPFENDEKFEFYSVYIYFNGGSPYTSLSELNFGYTKLK